MVCSGIITSGETEPVTQEVRPGSAAESIPTLWRRDKYLLPVLGFEPRFGRLVPSSVTILTELSRLGNEVLQKMKSEKCVPTLSVESYLVGCVAVESVPTFREICCLYLSVKKQTV
jgi:hypothetical protein